MSEPEVPELIAHDRAIAKRCPLGVWVLTALDVLVLGILTMVLAGKRIVALLSFDGPATGEFGAEEIRGTLALFVLSYGFTFLFAVAICLAARGAWLGKDRARAALVILITMNLFVAAPVNGFAVLGSLVLVPIHWWYFWLPSTLAYYE